MSSSVGPWLACTGACVMESSVSGINGTDQPLSRGGGESVRLVGLWPASTGACVGSGVGIACTEALIGENVRLTVSAGPRPACTGACVGESSVSRINETDRPLSRGRGNTYGW